MYVPSVCLFLHVYVPSVCMSLRVYVRPFVLPTVCTLCPVYTVYVLPCVCLLRVYGVCPTVCTSHRVYTLPCVHRVCSSVCMSLDVYVSSVCTPHRVYIPPCVYVPTYVFPLVCSSICVLPLRVQSTVCPRTVSIQKLELVRTDKIWYDSSTLVIGSEELRYLGNPVLAAKSGLSWVEFRWVR